jgi:hypothetical protein
VGAIRPRHGPWAIATVAATSHTASINRINTTMAMNGAKPPAGTEKTNTVAASQIQQAIQNRRSGWRAACAAAGDATSKLFPQIFPIALRASQADRRQLSPGTLP